MDTKIRAEHNFGYSRERNAVDGPPDWTTAELIQRRRRDVRRALASQPAPEHGETTS